MTVQVRRARAQLRRRRRATTAPGIPEYAEDKVFEKFYSLARPATAKKSTGLGLSFVKEIAELHRGRVTLKNGGGGGAVATLSLPLTPHRVA